MNQIPSTTESHANGNRARTRKTRKVPSAPSTAAPLAPESVACVVGMHRSGTSVVAKLVSLLGYSLGPEEGLMEGDQWNAKGYWENNDLVSFNEGLLKHYGGAWNRPPPRERLESDPPAELAARAQSLLSQTFGDAPRWAWKDPRTSLTIPFWRRIVPNLSFIICTRNPVEVCSSLTTREALQRRDSRLSFDEAEALWLRYQLDAVYYSKGSPRLFIDYDACMTDPAAEVERLASFLGIGDSQRIAAAKTEAQGFVEPDLSHYEASERSLLVAAVRPEIKAFYIALRALHGIDFKLAEKDIDALTIDLRSRNTDTERLAATEAELVNLQAAQERASVELRKLSVDLARAASERERREAELQRTIDAGRSLVDQALTQTAAEQARGANLAESLQATQAHALNLEAQVLAEQARATSLENGIESWKTHSATIEAERDNWKAHASKLEKDQADWKAHAGNLEKELTNWKGHAANLEAQLASEKTSAEALQAELESRRDDLKSRQDEVESLRSLAEEQERQVSELQSKLSQHDREQQALLAEARRRIQALEEQLEEAQSHSSELGAAMAGLSHKLEEQQAYIASLVSKALPSGLVSRGYTYLKTYGVSGFAKRLLQPWRWRRHS